MSKAYDPLQIARIAFRGQLDEVLADRDLAKSFLTDDDWFKRVGALAVLVVHFKIPEPELAPIRESLLANSQLDLERMCIERTIPTPTTQELAFGDRLEQVQSDRTLVDHYLKNGTFMERMGALCILSDCDLAMEERHEIARLLMQDSDPRVRFNALSFQAKPFLHSGDRMICSRLAKMALDLSEHEQVRISAAHLAVDVWFPNPLAPLLRGSEKLTKLTPQEKQEWLDSRAAIQLRKTNRQKGLPGIDWDWIREMAASTETD